MTIVRHKQLLLKLNEINSVMFFKQLSILLVFKVYSIYVHLLPLRSKTCFVTKKNSQSWATATICSTARQRDNVVMSQREGIRERERHGRGDNRQWMTGGSSSGRPVNVHRVMMGHFYCDIFRVFASQCCLR